MICGSGGSKSRLAKAAGAKSKVLKTDRFGAFLEVEMSKKCTPLWREECAKHMWKSKMLKTEAFGAKSTLRSQTCEKLTGSDHFWKLRC